MSTHTRLPDGSDPIGLGAAEAAAEVTDPTVWGVAGATIVASNDPIMGAAEVATAGAVGSVTGAAAGVVEPPTTAAAGAVAEAAGGCCVTGAAGGCSTVDPVMALTGAAAGGCSPSGG